MGHKDWSNNATIALIVGTIVATIISTVAVSFIKFGSFKTEFQTMRDDLCTQKLYACETRRVCDERHEKESETLTRLEEDVKLMMGAMKLTPREGI